MHSLLSLSQFSPTFGVHMCAVLVAGTDRVNRTNWKHQGLEHARARVVQDSCGTSGGGIPRIPCTESRERSEDWMPRKLGKTHSSIAGKPNMSETYALVYLYIHIKRNVRQKMKMCFCVCDWTTCCSSDEERMFYFFIVVSLFQLILIAISPPRNVFTRLLSPIHPAKTQVLSC